MVLYQKNIAVKTAGIDTITALVYAYTADGSHSNLLLHRKTLRVTAPFASKRTSLKEDLGPDTRSVMNSKSLYIEDNTFGFIVIKTRKCQLLHLHKRSETEKVLFQTRF